MSPGLVYKCLQRALKETAEDRGLSERSAGCRRQRDGVRGMVAEEARREGWQMEEDEKWGAWDGQKDSGGKKRR